MNDNKTYWTDNPELVEKYVLGQLTDEERLRLDAEIADCEPCKQKLRHELEMAAGIRRYGRDSLKAKLHSNLRKKQAAQFQQFQLVGLAAAVVIIAIGIGVYQIWFSELTTPKKFGSREIVFKQAEQPQDSSQSKIETGQAETEKSLAEAAEEKRDADESDATSGAGEVPEEIAASSSKDIAEEKPSGLDKKRRARPVSGDPKKMKSAPPSDMAMHDEISTKKESAGALSTVETKPFKANPQSPPEKIVIRHARAYKEQSIWLIGTVVMVADASPQSASKITRQGVQSEQFLAKEEGRQSKRQANRQSRTITVKRGEEDEQLVLQQRSFRELPAKRQTQLGKENHVETLLEQSKTGSLSLTIFSDALTEDDIESATVETVSDDSLIIATANQRIYYRLPAELSSRRSSRR